MITLKQNKLDYLSTIQIFRDLSKGDLAEMDRTTKMATCHSGKIFYMPEDSGEVLFLLKQGRVQLYRLTLTGKKIVIATLGPGAIFGEMSIIGQKLHDSYAEALEPCMLCVMSHDDVTKLLHEKPDVAFRLVQSLGEKISSLESRLEATAYKTIPMRLAELLLLLSDHGKVVIRGYTHQDFAETLGTYRETITQTLNEFRLAGCIEIGRKSIRIHDVAGLQQIGR